MTLIEELRKLSQDVAGAIDVLELLIAEGATQLTKDWASHLFRMAIEIEVRASNLARNNPSNTFPVEVRDVETREAINEASE